MFRKLFSWIWRNGSSKPTPFRPVVPTAWVAEYRGSIARTPFATHHLTICRLTPHIQKALLAEGFRGAGAIENPTHVFFCTVRLPRNPQQVRCLFNVFLDLREVGVPEIQDWVALQIGRSLRDSLLAQKDPWFLIRCFSVGRRLEYPWCVEDGVLDEFWLMETAVYARFYLRQTKNRQSPFVSSEDDRTEAQ